MNTLLIPCDTGKVSDGFHTFDDLYQHRNILFLSLMRAYPEKSWMSRKHDDGTGFDNMFVAGFETPEGHVTYHISNDLWQIALCTGCKIYESAPKWDGHTPDEVIGRLVRVIIGVRKTPETESVTPPVDSQGCS